jgi:uncharacterized protein (TIGR03000 family)
MNSPRRAGFSLVALVRILPVAAGKVASQDGPAKGETKLHVLLPKKRATLLINGKEIPGTGKERDVVAPPLAKGKKQYEVTANWATNNYTEFFRTRKVSPKPGGVVTVDLRTADPKNPDDIKIRFVPTPDDVVARMCQLAKVGKDDVVFDLGCGDGRIVIQAVEKFGAKRGVGVDLDPKLVKESKANAKKHGVSDKVEFREGDVLKIKELSDASVVMLYMGDDVNLLLRPILKKTLKPGSRVVSHRFGMGDWKPTKTETFTAKDGDEYTLLLWVIPKKEEGNKEASRLESGRGSLFGMTSDVRERAMGFEPTTSSLGSWHSTTELRPREGR